MNGKGFRPLLFIFANDNYTLRIHLGQLLKESGLSKNKFCQKAEIQHSHLNGYINNKNSLKSLTLFQTIFILIHYSIFSNLISKRNNTIQKFFQYILYPDQISHNKCLMHHQVVLKKCYH